MSPAVSAFTRWLTPPAAVLTALSCMPEDPAPTPQTTAPLAAEVNAEAAAEPITRGELSPDRLALTFTRALRDGPPIDRRLPPEAQPAEVGVTILPTLAALCGIPTVHVYFDTADEAITEADRTALKRVATCLTTPPLDDVRIVVIGHTDATGDPDFNAALSRRRATAVADAIGEAGIDPDRIELDFRGEANKDTRDPAARPLMRRVDVRVVETDPVAIRTGWYDLDGDRKVDIAEFPSYVATLVDMESWDPDGDAVITAAELAGALFTVWDIDATGVLDHVEFSEGVERWYPTDATLPMFLDYDRDADGVLTAGEMVAGAIIRRLDARWDLDGDDLLDAPELAAALGRLWDANGDGELNREELAAFAANYWRR
ncbi:MAG: OmpA family protein [Myxococcales bacterium]|nr:OmpA family protein [Myxococcales bacterium]